jgi:hypothetical protein
VKASGSSDEHSGWARDVAAHYTHEDLDAMNQWLDVNIELNQARLDAVTTRLSIVIASTGALGSLLASSATFAAWPATVLAAIPLVISASVAVFGLRSEWTTTRDPTSLIEASWGPGRTPNQILATLHNQRCGLYDAQDELIGRRARALRLSSWIAGAATLLTIVAISLSQGLA